MDAKPVGPSTEESKQREIIIPVPTNVVAAASGDFVLQEVKRQEPMAEIPAIVGSTVTFFATEAQKQGWRVKRVKLNLFGLLSIEWEQQ